MNLILKVYLSGIDMNKDQCAMDGLTISMKHVCGNCVDLYLSVPFTICLEKHFYRSIQSYRFDKIIFLKCVNMLS